MVARLPSRRRDLEGFLTKTIQQMLVYGRLVETQLWRLLVIASVDPRLGPEKGADGRELVNVESRQLEGIDCANAEALL